MTPGSRLAVGLFVALVLVGLAYFGSQQAVVPDVELLPGESVGTSELPPMLAAFKKANLNGYKIHGTSISVPRGQESAYMAALVSAKALPKKMGDFIDKATSEGSPFEGDTQREQRIQAAKQAELAMQIRKMAGVEDAYVIYDASKPRGFDKKIVKAVVSVKPAGSARLSPAVAEAIRLHVAGAIADLKPENVTVSDLNIANTAAPTAAVPQQPATVPTAAKQPAAAESLDAYGRIALAWAERHWQLLGGVALGLVVLVAFRAMVRQRSPAVETPTPSAAQAMHSPTAVPPPHRRRPIAVDRSLREELSVVVEEDPEAAANILRNWIGQGG